MYLLDIRISLAHPIIRMDTIFLYLDEFSA